MGRCVECDTGAKEKVVDAVIRKVFPSRGHKPSSKVRRYHSALLTPVKIAKFKETRFKLIGICYERKRREDLMR